MRRQNKRNAVQLLRQESGHRHVPGVRVHDIDSLESLDLRQIQAQRLQRTLEFPVGPIRNLSPRLSAAHVQVASHQICCGPQQCTSTSISRANSRLR